MAIPDPVNMLQILRDEYLQDCEGDDVDYVGDDFGTVIAATKMLQERAACAERAIRALHQWAEKQSPPLDKQFDDIIGVAYDEDGAEGRIRVALIEIGYYIENADGYAKAFAQRIQSLLQDSR